MTRFVPTLLAISALSVFSFANAQTAPGNAESKVKPVVQIDRPDVRVLRVEIGPGVVRPVHQHDDVKYHLFIPVTGDIELTLGSAPPVTAAPGQVFYIPKGTPHGFRNTGTTKGIVMEVFDKGDAVSSGKPSDATASAAAAK